MTRVAVVLAALAMACDSSGPTEPALSDYQIVFMQPHTTDSLAHLAAVDIESGVVARLLAESGVYSDLQASRDGRKVLFRRSQGPEPYGAHVMNADGSNIIQLSAVGVGYRWSPDGGRIASLIPVEAAGPDPRPPPTLFLRITDALGAVLVDFPHVESYFASRPSWSPDGSQLVYTEIVGGDDRLRDVMRARSDGSEIVNISNSPEYEGEVAWSPTAPLIAVAAVRGNAGGLFTMRADGSELTLRYLRAEAVGYHWSPDGARILFSDGAVENETRLIVMRADGSNPIEVARGKIGGGEAPWSPDGQWIAYSALGTSGEYDVYVVRPDGSERRNLTDQTGNGRLPVWVRMR